MNGGVGLLADITEVTCYFLLVATFVDVFSLVRSSLFTIYPSTEGMSVVVTIKHVNPSQ